MSKVSEFAFRKMPQEVVDFKDEVTTILNNGKYSNQIVTTNPPSWTARQGEAVFFDSSNTRRWYFYLSNSWRYVEFTSGGASGSVQVGQAGRLAIYAAGGGTVVDDLVIGSATTILAVNSSAASHEYFYLRASDNMTIVRANTAYFFSGVTNNMSVKQDSLTIPLIVGSGGTGQVTLTNRGILIGSGTNAVQVLAALNSGELIVGSSTLVAPQILGAGSQGQMLIADSSTRLGVRWADT